MSDYQVRDPKAEVALKKIGKLLAKVMPRGYGFTFLMFNFGEGGNLFYISNGTRQDVIKTMKEFIEKNTN